MLLRSCLLIPDYQEGSSTQSQRWRPVHSNNVAHQQIGPKMFLTCALTHMANQKRFWRRSLIYIYTYRHTSQWNWAVTEQHVRHNGNKIIFWCFTDFMVLCSYAFWAYRDVFCCSSLGCQSNIWFSWYIHGNNTDNTVVCWSCRSQGPQADWMDICFKVILPKQSHSPCGVYVMWPSSKGICPAFISIDFIDLTFSPKTFQYSVFQMSVLIPRGFANKMIPVILQSWHVLLFVFRLSQVGPYRLQGPRGPSGPSPNPSAWTLVVWATLSRSHCPRSSSNSSRQQAQCTQRPLQTALRTDTLLCNSWTASCLMQLQPQVGKDYPQCRNILLEYFQVPCDTFLSCLLKLIFLKRCGSNVTSEGEIPSFYRIHRHVPDVDLFFETVGRATFAQYWLCNKCWLVQWKVWVTPLWGNKKSDVKSLLA